MLNTSPTFFVTDYNSLFAKNEITFVKIIELIWVIMYELSLLSFIQNQIDNGI